MNVKISSPLFLRHICSGLEVPVLHTKNCSQVTWRGLCEEERLIMGILSVSVQAVTLQRLADFFSEFVLVLSEPGSQLFEPRSKSRTLGARFLEACEECLNERTLLFIINLH